MFTMEEKLYFGKFQMCQNQTKMKKIEKLDKMVKNLKNG